MTLLSDVDGNILEDVSLLQYPAVLHEDPVHEVVTLDPREGCCEVQVLCFRNVLGEKLDCQTSDRHCKTLGNSVAEPDQDPQEWYVLSLLDPDPDPVVRGTDPDSKAAPDPS
jgi:hypothetical protein